MSFVPKMLNPIFCFGLRIAATVGVLNCCAPILPACAHPAYQLFPEEEALVEQAPARKVPRKKPSKVAKPTPTNSDRASFSGTSHSVASLGFAPVADSVSKFSASPNSRSKSMTGGFDAGVGQIPHDSSGYYKRAEAEAKAKEYKAAISDCELVIKLDPRYTAAFYLRGLSKLATGDFNGALNDLDKVVTRDDNYPEVFYHRAEVRERQGDLHGAQVDWQTALKKAQESGDRRLETKIKAKIKAATKAVL